MSFDFIGHRIDAFFLLLFIIMKTAYSQTWTLYSHKKANEIVENLNRTDSDGFMYALKRISEASAAVEVFDNDGYSIGYV
jgi:hypothetical protein